ncbi:MAG: PTS sugar transporter subunit IIA [Gemmatimonadetes bacterium]|nr:PTS sugar transporter subunit IIA [Gemmatimonadota bacterium]
MLSELLTTERVRVPLGSHSKADLLRELTRLAVPDVAPETLDLIVAAVEEREAQVSTAMGGGLAVPHGRTDLVRELRVSAGLVHVVRDYVAPDHAPVEVVFLVLTPLDSSSQHIKVLARIARLMHRPESRAALLASNSAEAFLAVVRQAEAA